MEECPICLEKMNDETLRVTLSCDHVYHVRCLKRWVSTGQSCPVCRAEINVGHIRSLYETIAINRLGFFRRILFLFKRRLICVCMYGRVEEEEEDHRDCIITCIDLMMYVIQALNLGCLVVWSVSGFLYPFSLSTLLLFPNILFHVSFFYVFLITLLSTAFTKAHFLESDDDLWCLFLMEGFICLLNIILFTSKDNLLIRRRRIGSHVRLQNTSTTSTTLVSV